MTVQELALHLWQKREQSYPERVRRMHPDDFDRATGAWQSCLEYAEQMLNGGTFHAETGLLL